MQENWQNAFFEKLYKKMLIKDLHRTFMVFTQKRGQNFGHFDPK